MIFAKYYLFRWHLEMIIPQLIQDNDVFSSLKALLTACEDFILFHCVRNCDIASSIIEWDKADFSFKYDYSSIAVERGWLLTKGLRGSGNMFVFQMNLIFITTQGPLMGCYAVENGKSRWTQKAGGRRKEGTVERNCGAVVEGAFVPRAVQWWWCRATLAGRSNCTLRWGMLGG